jgi:hypothetical protein
MGLSMLIQSAEGKNRILYGLSRADLCPFLLFFFVIHTFLTYITYFMDYISIKKSGMYSSGHRSLEFETLSDLSCHITLASTEIRRQG